MKSTVLKASALLFLLVFAVPVFCQDYFYTPSVQERDSVVRSGYKLEGTCCFVSAAAKPGMIPLYRLFAARSGDHFYTTSEAERDTATRAGYKYEGICCYVFSTTNRSAGVPLYRLFHPRSGKHFYTALDTERQNAVRSGYRSEDLCCYVSSSSTAAADAALFRLYAAPKAPPNPAQITLSPWFSSATPGSTIDYRGVTSNPNIGSSYGCSLPKVTTVRNRSAFPIVLSYGVDGDPAQGQSLNPNQDTSAFSGNDVTGSWEAWGPDSGGRGRWSSVVIEVSWTC